MKLTELTNQHLIDFFVKREVIFASQTDTKIKHCFFVFLSAFFLLASRVFFNT